jgi:hypothetical protein
MKTGVMILAAALLCASACTMFQKSAGQEQPTTPQREAANVVFYTFPDIPVPKELTLQRERSFIYETPHLKAGVLVLTGNVDMASLETYFKTNMGKNGWRFVNSYKYGDVILNFAKDDKTSTVRMTRDPFKSTVEIWVGPIGGDETAPTAAKDDGFK